MGTAGESKSAVSSPSPSLPSSNDGMLTPDDSETSKIGDDGKVIPNLPNSPPLTDSTAEEPDYSKMNMYSPSTQEQFSTVPEHIATEAQSTLQTAASEVQGAKSYVPNAAEYTVSSHSELTTNYCTMTTLTTNGYSYTQPSSSPTALMSPVPYTVPTVPYNTAFGEAIGIGAYPSMSPSGYVSPYGTKQYTWPPTPSAVGYPSTFSMNSHDLTQSCYPYPVSSGGTYSQVAATRPGYPAGYFSAQLSAATTQSC